MFHCTSTTTPFLKRRIKAVGKDHLVRNFVDDAITLMHMLQNNCCLVCGVLAPGKLLQSPKEAVADPLPNICCLVDGVLLCNVT